MAPYSLLSQQLPSLCWRSAIYFAVTVLGYFAAAGSLYWALYLRRNSRFAAYASTGKVNSTTTLKEVATPEKAAPPKLTDIWTSIRSDVQMSVLSSGIFAVCAAIMTTAYELGLTRIYLQPERYGLWYIAASLILVVVLQDAYFYFTHRLSHHPKCYKWMHQGHHHSKNPTPWTAFAFDPAEALIQAIYLIGITLLLPIHISVLVALVMVMTMGALIHHFGVRLFDDSAFGRWLGSWMVGCTHHWFHHRKYTAHYSLYFTFWDRVMGTQYPGYEDMLTTRSAKAASESSTQLEPETVLLSEQNKTVAFPVSFDKAS